VDHYADRLIAHQVNHILQHPVWPIGDQLHPRGGGCFQPAEDIIIGSVGVRPGEVREILAGVDHRSLVHGDGTLFLALHQAGRKAEIWDHQGGVIIPGAAAGGNHPLDAALRGGKMRRLLRGGSQFGSQASIQAIVEKKLEQRRPAGDLAAQHGQQVIKIRLAFHAR